MEATHRYMNFLISENPIYTDEGKQIEVFYLDIRNEPEIFQEWAKELRRNYCSDEMLKHMTEVSGMSASKYLNNNKLPSNPSVQSGDFGEIFVSDYLQSFENYLVPRTRFNSRENKDRPTLGSDVLGYKINPHDSVEAEVIVIEVKSSASKRNDTIAKNKLQEAIDGSNKDFIRFSTSIVASYEKLYSSNRAEADILSRFLNITDNPYQVKYAAVAIHSNYSYDIEVIKKVVAEQHLDSENLRLLVIHSDELMAFIKNIYLKAGKV